MGLIAFLTIAGAHQGNISSGAGSADSLGQAATTGHTDEISVYAVKGDFTTPRDTSTGLVTGVPIPLGFTITKPFDKASPLVFQAWATSELLTIELHWYRPDPTGSAKPQLYFSHKFEQALIVNLIQYMPNVLAPENASFAQMEDVMFTYKRLSVTHMISATTAQWQHA